MPNKTVLEFLKSRELKDKFDNFWIKKVFLFGSYARWEENKNSDLDFLIEPDTKIHKLTLFDLIDLEKFIKSKLWVKKVDFWTRRSMNKYIMPLIEKDLIQIK